MRTVPRVGAIMNRSPLVFRPDTLVREAAGRLVRSGAPAAVVLDEQRRLLGIFSQQSLMLALAHIVHHELPAGPVSEYLDSPPPSVEETTPLLTVVQVFADSGHAHPLLPVLCDARLVGTVSRLDVARVFRTALAKAVDPAAIQLYFSAWRADDAPFDARARET